MKPPGFLNIRRESNSSESSVESVAGQEVVEQDRRLSPSTPQRIPVVELSSEDKIKLEAADQAAKNKDKIHYFPRDLPVYSCRSCLVPIVRLLGPFCSRSFMRD